MLINFEQKSKLTKFAPFTAIVLAWAGVIILNGSNDIHRPFGFTIQVPSNAFLFLILIALISQISPLAQLLKDQQFALAMRGRNPGGMREER